jgi:SAM-dependent methyltransferase
VPVGFFEDLYRADPDPWGFATSTYERRKYDITLASLPRPTYRSAFEPGCSLGVLTSRLAARCAAVLAVDAVASVVERAADALSGEPHVRVEHLSVPEEWPAGTFDLVVLSELGYYFTSPELDTMVVRTTTSLEPGGDVVAVHWTGETRYPLEGTEVALRFDRAGELERVVEHRERHFELGVWTKR